MGGIIGLGRFPIILSSSTLSNVLVCNFIPQELATLLREHQSQQTQGVTYEMTELRYNPDYIRYTIGLLALDKAMQSEHWKMPGNKLTHCLYNVNPFEFISFTPILKLLHIPGL